MHDIIKLNSTRLNVYRSSEATIIGTDTFTTPIFLKLAFKLNVYVTYFTPSRVANYSRTVFRVTFLGVEDSFLHSKNGGIP